MKKNTHTHTHTHAPYILVARNRRAYDIGSPTRAQKAQGRFERSSCVTRTYIYVHTLHVRGAAFFRDVRASALAHTMRAAFPLPRCFFYSAHTSVAVVIFCPRRNTFCVYLSTASSSASSSSLLSFFCRHGVQAEREMRSQLRVCACFGKKRGR